MWYYYDDCKNHIIVADKETWDLFNRLLLLLESNGELHMEKNKRIWDVNNLIAGLLLLSFIYIVAKTGWGEHLFIYSMPLGIVSIILSFLNIRSERKRYNSKVSIEPFPSFRSLRFIRESLPRFRKIKYPIKLSKRRVRNIIFEKTLFFSFRVIWLILAPIALFCQMFPVKEFQSEIKISKINNSN